MIANFRTPMRPCILLLLLLSFNAVAQDTFSVSSADTDSTAPMNVCSESHPPTAGPCAAPPRPLSRIPPLYPQEARQSRIEGEVYLAVVIGEDGSTRDIRVTNSLGHGLDEAAITAVKQWKFQPATYQGKSVPVFANLHVRFTLTPGAAPSKSSPPASEANSEQVRNLWSDAEAALNRHDYQAAADLARRITTLSPQSGAWNLLGNSLLNLYQLDGAIAAFQTQIKVDPASPYAYNNLGRVYWMQHKYDDAIAQFKEQLVINPQDHYAHTNLGMLLRDLKKCDAAIPELQKAITITPNNPQALLGLGECDLDLGHRDKGISELEQATSVAPAAGMWNAVAYALAKRNLDLDLAQKWAQTAISISSAQTTSVSLHHVTAAQFGLMNAAASFWDTLGWIYFLQGKLEEAQQYVEAAWYLLPVPIIGDHLGQIYEKASRRDDALKAYAMVIASSEAPRAMFGSEAPEALAHATRRVNELAGANNAQQIMAQGHADLQAMMLLALSNPAHRTGTADFVLNTSGKRISGAHRVSGDTLFEAFSTSLQSAKLLFAAPEGSLTIVRRGTLSCATADKCTLTLLNAREAFDIAAKEASASTPGLVSTTADPHIYDSASMGMRLALLDGWSLVKDEPGSYSRPHNVMFGKQGTMAYLLLTREHLESSPELYRKVLDSYFSQHEDFTRMEERNVTLDGISGTRWKMRWREKGVSYVTTMEFFTVGDDHYRVTALAPAEVFSRYEPNFEDMIKSVRFPMLHASQDKLDDIR
jgi:TonB family protein